MGEVAVCREPHFQEDSRCTCRLVLSDTVVAFALSAASFLLAGQGTFAYSQPS